MAALPIIKARQLIKVLTKLGFVAVRQTGSHRFFQHPDGRTTVVPLHASEDIGKGLLKAILKDIKISPEAFKKLLKK